jgi:hypothetical protein
MRAPRIYIASRGTDSFHYNARLSVKLSERFGSKRVIYGFGFFYMHGKKGRAQEQRWREFLESYDLLHLLDADVSQAMIEAVRASDVMVVLVGRHWFEDSDGISHLDNELDYMRLILATGLSCGLHVIPVLMPACRMPRAEELPEDLRRFARFSPIEVDFDSWEKNSDKLLDIIEGLPPKDATIDRPQTSAAMHASVETLIERSVGISRGRILSGHTDFPACMTFSPDSRLIASGSYDQTVRVWNASTGEMLWTREDHWPMALGVAFSPDGRTLACTGERRSGDYSSKYGVWLYDVETGRILRRLAGHTSYVNCVAFSPDGRMLATASNDRTVKLWDLDDDPRKFEMDRLAFTLLGHTGAVWGIGFSPDSQLLASASGDGTVRIWNLPNRFESHILKHTARSVAFSPDGRLLASDLMESGSSDAGPRYSLLLTEVETGRALGKATPVRHLLALGWTPDSSVVAVRSENSLRLLHAESGRLIFAQPMAGGSDGRGYVRPLCVSPDGRLLATFTGGPTHDLQLWDISALDVGPQAREAMEQPRAAASSATDVSLREHLRTLPFAHAALPTPARAAAWLRSAAATGVRPPLYLVQDLGAILTEPRSQLELARPAHLPTGLDTSSYLQLLTRLAAHPLLREVSTWDINESMAGVVIARLVAGLSFSEIYGVPGGVEAVAYSERLGKELAHANAGRIWREMPVAERPDLSHLLPADAMARIEANLRRLDSDELRFLHRYGPRFAGTPDPREMLDLFNLLDLPPAVRLAMAQVMRLLPRVSKAAHKSGGMQTYAMGGYAGLTHRGSLDSLVPTELAYPSQMLLHRMLNQEALYYGRDAEKERQREVAYILTQAGLDVRGDVDVMARALTLALVEAMQGRGYEVRQSFVGSHWTQPAEMMRPIDVQRLLYYRDEGALRSREMLMSVLGQLRAWRDYYRGLHVIWVVGEHWDADELEENRDLYATLKSWANQQAWFIRLDGEDTQVSREEPVAARSFGHSQIINSALMWAKREPAVVMYTAPEEAVTEIPVAESWVEPSVPPSHVMLTPHYYSGQGGEVQDFISSELRARGHMVMIDSVLTDQEHWLSGLANVELLMPIITKESADSAVAIAAVKAARALARRGEGPRPLPVRVAYEGPSRVVPGDANNPSQCFMWRSAEDNPALLRAMIESLAPAPSLLRFDGLYHEPFNHPTQLREWFRFYPDGRVVSITTTEGSLESATRWLGEELRDGTARDGRYDVNGSRIRMNFQEKGDEGGVWSYAGVIGNNSLSLDGTHNGIRLTRTDYQFVPVPDFTAAPPPPSLHFDGAYLTQVECVDWTHPEKDWSWMARCLKFRPGGAVYYSMVWSMNTAADFDPNERDERGTYTVEGDAVQMVFKNSTGETRSCRARIQGDDLSVSGSCEGAYHFVTPPAPPVRGVRLDGVYTHQSYFIDEVHPDRAGWDRFTLRFYSDGTVASLYSGSWGDEVPELQKPDVDDVQGTYTAGETIIEITMRSSSGETRDWYGTIKGDSITLTMNNRMRQFSFVSD